LKSCTFSQLLRNFKDLAPFLKKLLEHCNKRRDAADAAMPCLYVGQAPDLRRDQEKSNRPPIFHYKY
jgi:hypothetical protein